MWKKGITTMLKKRKDAAVAPKEAAVDAAVSSPEPIERQILRDTAKALDAARQLVAKREADVERLALVIAEGEKAESALMASIASDGGVGIAAVVTGSKLDAVMQSSVAIEVAARAARARQPHAQAELEEVRRAAMKVEADRNLAAHNLLKLVAGKQVAEYRDHWSALCRLYDEILGISAALPPLDRMETPIASSTAVFAVPSLSLGSTGTYSPTMSHVPSTDWRVSARWNAARQALLDDPAADIAKVLAAPCSAARF